MRTEREIKDELERIFPGESNSQRLNQWSTLINYGQTSAAENLVRKWEIEASQNIKMAIDPSRRANIYYTNLTKSRQASGIKVRGFKKEIGRIFTGKSVIEIQAGEFVDIDLEMATYSVDINISKDGEKYLSSVSYNEIDILLNAIDALRKVGAGVTQFPEYQVDWIGKNNFSLHVFNNDSGDIKGLIRGNGVNVFLETIKEFDTLKNLVLAAKNYIESNHQIVGNVDFLIGKIVKEKQAEILSKLPEIISEQAVPHLHILSIKRLQLTYIDDYGLPEFSNFYSEVDRYTKKFFPDLNEDHREIAKEIIADMVNKYILNNPNFTYEFDSSAGPLEYERHCAGAFEQAGWSTRLTPKSGDQGADLIVNFNDMTGVVQCKLYSQPVGNSAVQEVIAAREYYKATIAIVVSNATYTNSARQLASIANVFLLHHSEIQSHSIKMGVVKSSEVDE